MGILDSSFKNLASKRLFSGLKIARVELQTRRAARVVKKEKLDRLQRQ